MEEGFHRFFSDGAVFTGIRYSPEVESLMIKRFSFGTAGRCRENRHRCDCR